MEELLSPKWQLCGQRSEVLKVTEQRVLTYCPVSKGQKDLPAGSKSTIYPILEEERGNILRSITCSRRMLLASGHWSDFSLQTKLCCKRLGDDYPLIRLVAACRCQENMVSLSLGSVGCSEPQVHAHLRERARLMLCDYNQQIFRIH